MCLPQKDAFLADPPTIPTSDLSPEHQECSICALPYDDDEKAAVQLPCPEAHAPVICKSCLIEQATARHEHAHMCPFRCGPIWDQRPDRFLRVLQLWGDGLGIREWDASKYLDRKAIEQGFVDGRLGDRKKVIEFHNWIQEQLDFYSTYESKPHEPSYRAATIRFLFLNIRDHVRKEHLSQVANYAGATSAGGDDIYVNYEQCKYWPSIDGNGEVGGPIDTPDHENYFFRAIEHAMDTIFNRYDGRRIALPEFVSHAENLLVGRHRSKGLMYMASWMNKLDDAIILALDSGIAKEMGWDNPSDMKSNVFTSATPMTAQAEAERGEASISNSASNTSNDENEVEDRGRCYYFSWLGSCEEY